jgi:hypothetical protein
MAGTLVRHCDDAVSFQKKKKLGCVMKSKSPLLLLSYRVRCKLSRAQNQAPHSLT